MYGVVLHGITFLVTLGLTIVSVRAYSRTKARQFAISSVAFGLLTLVPMLEIVRSIHTSIISEVFLDVFEMLGFVLLYLSIKNSAT